MPEWTEIAEILRWWLMHLEGAWGDLPSPAPEPLNALFEEAVDWWILRLADSVSEAPQVPPQIRQQILVRLRLAIAVALVHERAGLRPPGKGLHEVFPSIVIEGWRQTIREAWVDGVRA
jgi:hypothetical protein